MECFSEVECELPINVLTLFRLKQRQRRRTLRVMSVSDSYVTTLYPYLDDDVVEFFLALNVKYKKYKRAYGQVLVRFFPEIARIIRPNHHISMKTEVKWKHAIQLFIRSKERVKKFIPQVGGEPSQYLDLKYSNALKTDLSNFTLECLLSLARRRELLKEDYVVGLLNDHISGKRNAYYLLLKLVTLELFLRQMFDGSIPGEVEY